VLAPSRPVVEPRVEDLGLLLRHDVPQQGPEVLLDGADGECHTVAAVEDVVVDLEVSIRCPAAYPFIADARRHPRCHGVADRDIEKTTFARLVPQPKSGQDPDARVHRCRKVTDRQPRTLRWPPQMPWDRQGARQ